VGALGVRQTALYGPESGFWGLGLNLVAAILLWRWWQRRRLFPSAPVVAYDIEGVNLRNGEQK
jgi:hypothetical protein